MKNELTYEFDKLIEELIKGEKSLNQISKDIRFTTTEDRKKAELITNISIAMLCLNDDQYKSLQKNMKMIEQALILKSMIEKELNKNE